jgi:hypothetical protein
MRNSEGPGMVGATGPPSARRLETREHWHNFLADECQKDNGLLCFYDRQKSPEVAYLCGLLADCLMGASEKSGEEEPGTLMEMGALPNQGEKSFAPLKSLSKV